MDKLHRTRLLFGNGAIDRMRDATVMVVGCGAVGSFATEALARSGIGHLILIDHDVVEESNINRQLFALQSTVNRPKVDVARERIADINSDIIVDAHQIFFDDKFNGDLKPDYVIDAIDTVPSKIALYKWCQARNIPFISSMGAAQRTDPSMVRVTTLYQTSVCPLAARVRRMTRDENIADFPVVFSAQVPHKTNGFAKNLGSLVTVTGAFGLTAANWVILNLANK